MLQVPELNLVPPELLGRRWAPQEKRLALLALALGALALLQVNVHGTKAINAFRAALPDQLKPETSLSTQTANLEEQVQELQNQLRQAQITRSDVLQLSTPWGDLLKYFYGAAPSGVLVDTVRQSATDLTINGTAPSFTAVLDYRRALQQPKIVNAVEISSSARDPNSGRTTFSFRIALLPGGSLEPR